MFSFVKNPEIRISVKESKLLEISSDLKRQNVQSTIQFTKEELDLLSKLDEIQLENVEIKKNDKNTAKSKNKKQKQKELTLNELKQIKSQLGKDEYLCDLLIDADLILPENEIVPRNPELEERIQKLKAAQANREYDSMVRNVDARKKFEPSDTIAFQMKQINRQLIAVAQFVFSVIAGFFFGFLGIELLVGELDFGFRLLLGIIIALIIALAEIYFLAKRLIEEENDEIIVQEKVIPHPSGKLKTN